MTSHCILIFCFLMINDVEHLLICFLAVRMSSLRDILLEEVVLHYYHICSLEGIEAQKGFTIIPKVPESYSHDSSSGKCTLSPITLSMLL